MIRARIKVVTMKIDITGHLRSKIGRGLNANVEDPELTSSHQHTKSIPTYAIPPEEELKTEQLLHNK